MDKIRIGKDIFISWELTTTDESVILSKDSLSLEMTLPNRCIAQLPITFNDGVLYSSFYGIDQTQLGNYWLTVWYKRNEVGQSALDKVLAFQLVRSTEDETHNDESIAYADINLSGTIEINKGSVDTYTKEEINDLIADVHESFQAADLQYNIIAQDYTDESINSLRIELKEYIDSLLKNN